MGGKINYIKHTSLLGQCLIHAKVALDYLQVVEHVAIAENKIVRSLMNSI